MRLSGRKLRSPVGFPVASALCTFFGPAYFGEGLVGLDCPYSAAFLYICVVGLPVRRPLNQKFKSEVSVECVNFVGPS